MKTNSLLPGTVRNIIQLLRDVEQFEIIVGDKTREHFAFRKMKPFGDWPPPIL
ncbi:hypothetical protein KCP77_08485 [Salmonella enterica subsp. enterica]|nr:hypothetical protein KCP77_08485 [Salmonella enterica subsp. enterica]